MHTLFSVVPILRHVDKGGIISILPSKHKPALKSTTCETVLRKVVRPTKIVHTLPDHAFSNRASFLTDLAITKRPCVFHMPSETPFETQAFGTNIFRRPSLGTHLVSLARATQARPGPTPGPGPRWAWDPSQMPTLGLGPSQARAWTQTGPATQAGPGPSWAQAQVRSRLLGGLQLATSRCRFEKNRESSGCKSAVFGAGLRLGMNRGVRFRRGKT